MSKATGHSFKLRGAKLNEMCRTGFKKKLKQSGGCLKCAVRYGGGRYGIGIQDIFGQIHGHAGNGGLWITCRQRTFIC